MIEEPSILDYLSKKGIELRKEGNKYFCSSPFSRDSSWSFCIYPYTNSFFDWSNGFGGSVWRLMSKLEGKTEKELKSLHYEYEKFKPYKKTGFTKSKETKVFDYTRYINHSAEECKKIKEYADSRGLEEGNYFCGVFFTRDDSGHQEGGFDGQGIGREASSVSREEGAAEREGSGNGIRGLRGDVGLRHASLWIRNPAVGFIHYDQNLQICGVKFRRLDNQTPRFSARGALGIYLPELSIINVQTEEATVYVVEGEANAVSLNQYVRNRFGKACALSFGGVGICSVQLPIKCQKAKIKLIIDYDGNEVLYQERLKLYEHLNAEPIKLILPKGEDINSLKMKNKLYLIENLL